jgi:hypothetical protein
MVERAAERNTVVFVDRLIGRSKRLGIYRRQSRVHVIGKSLPIRIGIQHVLQQGTGKLAATADPVTRRCLFKKVSPTVNEA